MLYRESLFVLKIPTLYINVYVLCGQTVEFMLNFAVLEVTARLKTVNEACSCIRRYFGVVLLAAPHLSTHSLG